MTAGSKNAWNPAFSKLLGPQAKKQKLGSAESTELPLNGACVAIEASDIDAMLSSCNMISTDCLRLTIIHACIGFIPW